MGSPGADGNTMAVQYPRTEYVGNVRAIERELIHECIPGERNWEELLRSVFLEKYPKLHARIDVLVQVSMRRIKRGYVPACVMERFHEHRAFHKRSMLK